MLLPSRCWVAQHVVTVHFNTFVTQCYAIYTYIHGYTVIFLIHFNATHFFMSCFSLQNDNIFVYIRYTMLYSIYILTQCFIIVITPFNVNQCCNNLECQPQAQQQPHTVSQKNPTSTVIITSMLGIYLLINFECDAAAKQMLGGLECTNMYLLIFFMSCFSLQNDNIFVYIRYTMVYSIYILYTFVILWYTVYIF